MDGAEAPTAGAPLGLRETVLRAERNRPGGGEVAIRRLVGALVDLDVVHDFRNEPVEIRIPLPVGVRHHVDGDSVHGDGDIRPVIGVEAA